MSSSAVIWGLVSRANEVQRTSLLYSARSIAAGVDAELGKFIALAESLARSPALLDDNLDAFEAEARREFPKEGGAWVLVADVNGQQLINTLAQPGEPLPPLNPHAIEAQQRALATGSNVISDVLRSPVAQDWVADIVVPLLKNGQPYRGLAVGIRGREFLPLLSVRDIPKNWLVGVIDGQGRFIARVPKGRAEVGQLASQGWRAIKDRTGVFEYPSLEGDELATNALAGAVGDCAALPANAEPFKPGVAQLLPVAKGLHGRQADEGAHALLANTSDFLSGVLCHRFQVTLR